jgi:UDP-N-acetylmuramoyl-L-alanyl-D-glutamate--2,6-diaminopimelate ligase
LRELATVVGARVLGDPDTIVTDVTHDSRLTGPGFLFAALKGGHVDGHDFVGQAVGAGSSAVLVSHQLDATKPQLIVDDPRAVLGTLCAAVHDHPSRTMDVVGVTGTNGKTTVTHFVASIGAGATLSTGLIGTIHTRIGDREIPAGLTTPEAPEFQRLLARMRDEGVALVAAEVSSHALELGRVQGTEFAVAAFTNISQDHLDFHGDMDSYRAVKSRLFTDYEVGTAVVNVDDELGTQIAGGFDGNLLTVGAGADVSFGDLEHVGDGTAFSLDTPWGSVRVQTPVMGEFNVANLALAAACCLAVGIDFESVAAGMEDIEGVPGRFETVSGADPIMVIVDYAHTPVGVARAVAAGRRLAQGRVIGLIGAGGDRDRRKRAAMGAAISAADLVVVTSDNPRSEKPEAIIAAVEAGVEPGTDCHVEVDRRLAIRLAIDAAEDGDVVLILGRGHETHQQIDSRLIDFDDREVAAAALAAKRSSTESSGSSGSMTP